MFGFSFRALVVRIVAAGKTVKSIVTALSMALAAAGLAATSAHANGILMDPVIYDNGVALTAVIGGLDSQLSTSTSDTFDTMSADNFTLPSGRWWVTDVHWYGGCDVTVNSNCALDGANPLDFKIVFFDDAGGEPTGGGATATGASVRTTAIGLETQNLTGIDTGVDIGTVDGIRIFEYWADLVTPLLLDGGTPYWLSVQAVRDFPPVWLWAFKDSTNGDGLVGDPSFGLPYWSAVGGAVAGCAAGGCEFAFSLTGHRVPEPASLALFGAGLAGLGFLRRPHASRRRFAPPQHEGKFLNMKIPHASRSSPKGCVSKDRRPFAGGFQQSARTSPRRSP